MPADLFLKLGNVKGESVDLKHAGEMELLSARWGMQVAVGANGGVLALLRVLSLLVPRLLVTQLLPQSLLRLRPRRLQLLPSILLSARLCACC